MQNALLRNSTGLPPVSAWVSAGSSSRNVSKAQETRPGRLPVWSFSGTTSVLADVLRQTECPHSSLSHLGNCRFFRRMESIRSVLSAVFSAVFYTQYSILYTYFRFGATGSNR